MLPGWSRANVAGIPVDVFTRIDNAIFIIVGDVGGQTGKCFIIT